MRCLLAFCIILVSCFQTEAQRLGLPDSNKYRINLPDYWKPGNKIWQILTDKLPLVCEELKDKDICGDDCTPFYTIEFIMSDPVIFSHFPIHISSTYTNNQHSKPTETWEIQTSYGFECSLLLRNEKGIYTKRFIIVDTNEVWKISNRVVLNSYAPAPQQNIFYRRTSNRSGIIDPLANPSNLQVTPATGQQGETPFAYINRNKEKLVPSWRDMFAVVDLKINSW